MKVRLVSLILSAVGVLGVGVTSVLSVKCHDKAKDKEEKKDKAKCYIPAVVSGVATSACIIGSHHISAKEIAALTASCTYLAANKSKIERKISEKYGNDALKDIRREVNRELVKENKKNQNVTIEKTGYGMEHFVESELAREFYCSKEHVDWAFRMLNQMYRNGKDVNMNTLYELLGLKKSKAGFEFGWPNESDYDFGYSLDEPIHHEIVTGEDEDGNLMYWVEISATPPICGYLEA